MTNNVVHIEAVSKHDPEQTASLEFFLVRINNAHTRRAYAFAVRDLLLNLKNQGISDLRNATPLSIARWSADMQHLAPTTIKQRIAAVHMYLDWMVVQGLLPANPAASIKGPRFSQTKGKTSVLAPEEARLLIGSIGAETALDLRDRALIGVMLYSFARIGACLRLTVADVLIQNRRLWLRLREKGGKLHEMPCHHELENWLDHYLQTALHGRLDTQPLFPSLDRASGALSTRALVHSNAYAMVRRRAKQAGIQTSICNHTFRATGITAYLTNSGTLEMAARLAGHSSTRTTQLYDRRNDAVTLSEIERIRF